MAAKARFYLRAGTPIVWVIWPRSGHIDIWRAEILTVPATVLTLGGILDGEHVLSGFTDPVDDLFLDPLRPEREKLHVRSAFYLRPPQPAQELN